MIFDKWWSFESFSSDGWVILFGYIVNVVHSILVNLRLLYSKIRTLQLRFPFKREMIIVCRKTIIYQISCQNSFVSLFRGKLCLFNATLDMYQCFITTHMHPLQLVSNDQPSKDTRVVPFVFSQKYMELFSYNYLPFLQCTSSTSNRILDSHSNLLVNRMTNVSKPNI